LWHEYRLGTRFLLASDFGRKSEKDMGSLTVRESFRYAPVTEELFQYASWCPNQQVNSIWLRTAIEEAIAQSKQTPKKIRFFRRQMSNMIVKACEELGIPAQASRRTYTIDRWLQQRIQDFYPNQPGYQASAEASSFVRYEPQTPQPLPDALEGQKWAFVTLEAAAFEEMDEWDIDFGEAFPLSNDGACPRYSDSRHHYILF
jgi:hypothetical protein